MLKVGDKAPLEIPILDKEGKEVTLGGIVNKPTVLYFYPADDTPGCNAEACEFRDFNSEIEKLGYKVIGISKDSVKSHNKFTKKFELNFDIFSDVDHKLQEAFGIWQMKKMFGKEFMGTLRTTFILDENGVITKVWESVTPEGHAKEVYDYLKSL